MSKRFFPQQPGERKKAKLDITISDHNFPLSQNAAANNDFDNWGDDNDDEMLLMASQACEQAYGNNTTLPDFSLCMQPGATSTQMFPEPGPSKEFTFKKPTANSPHLTSTHLKDKCTRISSPLPGMSSKVISNGETMKYNDDLIYNDKVYKGQDPDHVYRQLLQLQEENAKLKSENGKLMDKCVTKEGEASILRTQLKSCQVAVDNARMEKIKAQEKVQMEWTEKLGAVNGQMHDLRTQLDFKNLEIISIKERCRMLESTKVKLTQVTVPSNEISSSHRHNNMSFNHNLSQRRVKTSSAAAQTDSKAHFLKLHKSHKSATPNLTSLLPAILEPTTEQPSLLDCNEKLQTDLDQTQRPCRVFSTFHRVPANRVLRQRGGNMSVGCIHEDLTSIANGENVAEKLDKIVKATCAVLTQVQQQLKEVQSRMTTAFQRDMDQRYIDVSGTFVPVTKRMLLSGRALYKEEQGILARRMVATIAFLLDRATNIVPKEQAKKMTQSVTDGILHVLSDVCSLLDSTSCATLYNGLLYSTALLPLRALLKPLIACRPMPSVSCRILRVLRRTQEGVCGGSGSMRMDLEQGVLLYKKDSCHLHVLLKQIEVALKCIEKQNLVSEALSTAQDLLGFYTNYARHNPQENRCDCQLVLVQVLVYALRICSLMLKACQSSKDKNLSPELVSTCRAGVLVLQQRGSRSAEWGGAEGPALDFLHSARSGPQPELFGKYPHAARACWCCSSGARARRSGAARRGPRSTSSTPRGAAPSPSCSQRGSRSAEWGGAEGPALDFLHSARSGPQPELFVSTCRAGVLVLQQRGSRSAEWGGAEGPALDFLHSARSGPQPELFVSTCRAGVLVLQQRGSRSAEWGGAEGPALDFLHSARSGPQPELFENMLIELAGTFQCATEDPPPSYHRQAWIKSFDAFSLAD
ncbi:uncharacterized protein LOC133525311 [Cydia pomonella]|uniref:uncharacterized protein LOC133525311 n=1 Tax=Cydia pomonella TaxID=82600 RepID=UPI002ADE35B5|nr:uncharacterized protein LOC133525311 [Cydia pomonella]